MTAAFTRAFGSAFNSALLHFLWQGALVATLLWIILLLLRRRAATTRYAACCAALGVMTLLPVVTTVFLYQPAATTVAPAKDAPAAIAPAVGAPSFIVPSAAPIAARVAAALSAAPMAKWLALVLMQARMWALPLWSLGVLIFALRLAWGCRQVAAFRASGQPADDALAALVERLAARMHLAGPIAMLISARAVCPSVVGWLRPVILMPAATVLGLTPRQLEAVLAHELAHIRRHDYLVNLLQGLVETLLFYHPAIWWVSRRIREERELCCDDLAVSCCHDAVGYARALTELEKLRGAVPAIAMAGNGGSLMYRIQRLLGVESQESRPSKLTGLFALCIGLLCVALNVGWVVRAREEMKGITGIVILELAIDRHGDVNDARVLSGPMELRKAALRSVLDRHFPPGAASRTVEIGLTIEPSSGKVIEAKVAERRHLERSQEELENRAVEVQRQAEALARSAQQLNSNAIRQEDEKLRQLRQQVAEFEQRGLALSEKVGRIVQKIDIVGLDAASRDQLAGRLPVHLGDLLTHELAESITAAVNQANAGIQYRLQEEGKVALVITLPESSVVQVGDRLTIAVRQHAEVSADLTVGESCRITLGQVKDIEVCGLDLRQIHKVLAEQLGKFLETPHIMVGMKRPGGRYLYYTGGFQQP